MRRQQNRKRRQNRQQPPDQRGYGDNGKRPEQKPFVAVPGVQIAPEIEARHHEDGLRYIQQRERPVIDIHQLKHDIGIERDRHILQQQP
ncbi:hypothetical protein D3C73_998510 [compost metagenome]